MDIEVNNEDIIGTEISKEANGEIKEEKSLNSLGVKIIDIDCNNGINLGKLRKTLSEKCSECGCNLQIRVRENEVIEFGEVIFEEEVIKICSKCGTEYDYEDKRQRRKKDKINRNIEEEDGRNARNKKFSRTKNDYGENRYRSDRGSKQEGSKKTKGKYH